MIRKEALSQIPRQYECAYHVSIGLHFKPTVLLKYKILKGWLFMGVPVIVSGTETRCQAISDIIESVALEQAALAHILNAEGEKIQKVVNPWGPLAEDSAAADPFPWHPTTQELLDTNKSVKRMVDAVSRLELVLQAKLDLFSDCVCTECSTTSTTTTTTTRTKTNYID